MPVSSRAKRDNSRFPSPCLLFFSPDNSDQPPSSQILSVTFSLCLDLETHKSNLLHLTVGTIFSPNLALLSPQVNRNSSFSPSEAGFVIP